MNFYQKREKLRKWAYDNCLTLIFLGFLAISTWVVIILANVLTR